MNTRASYNHQQRLKAIVVDIFGSARSFHSTHAQILDRLTLKVYNDPAWLKLPSHVRVYISAWIEFQFQDIDRHYLAWRIYWRGNLVDSSEILPGTWNECVSGYGAHVWKDAPDRIYSGGPDNPIIPVYQDGKIVGIA